MEDYLSLKVGATHGQIKPERLSRPNQRVKDIPDRLKGLRVLLAPVGDLQGPGQPECQRQAAF